jgi:hypothetical protein
MVLLALKAVPTLEDLVLHTPVREKFFGRGEDTLTE